MKHESERRGLLATANSSSTGLKVQELRFCLKYGLFLVPKVAMITSQTRFPFLLEITDFNY